MHHQFCDKYLVRMDHKLARDYFSRFYSFCHNKLYGMQLHVK